ncbi:MAG: triphosphoribosyl-dephospho-CoA synthase [Acidilobus sp.]
MASATSSRGSEACELAPLLAVGSVVEPVAHPKPGAVTRLLGQPDKDVVAFALHSAAVTSAAVASCNASIEGLPDPILVGLRAYRRSLEALGVRVNVGLGQAMMIIPLSAALARSGKDVRGIASTATGIVLSSSPEAAAEYYEILRLLSPSHLGAYRGPLPDVIGGRPTVGLGQLLRAVRWDLVASELTNGYPLTLRAVADISSRGGVSEESVVAALADVLIEAGDTLIARRWGVRAFLASRAEVLTYVSELGPGRAMALLDPLWRARGWSPGAALDIIAAAVGLYLVSRALARLS